MSAAPCQGERRMRLGVGPTQVTPKRWPVRSEPTGCISGYALESAQLQACVSKRAWRRAGEVASVSADGEAPVGYVLG
ncbi:MAG: hypothetical protein JWN48_5893 [Myxococcaceae bacterium]|nr:hypothetical protein [Myxococcaceae bacterium]